LNQLPISLLDLYKKPTDFLAGMGEVLQSYWWCNHAPEQVCGKEIMSVFLLICVVSLLFSVVFLVLPAGVDKRASR
jgi:hypothetical protein